MEDAAAEAQQLSPDFIKKGYHLLTDKYKSFNELNKSISQAEVKNMQIVLAFDFSASNNIEGLHDLERDGKAYENPYMRVINILQPVAQKFDKDGIINAYRFGCSETKDKKVLPLYGDSDEYKGFESLMNSYKLAV